MFVQFVRQSWAGLGLVMGCVVQNLRRVAEMKGGGDGGAVRVCCKDGGAVRVFCNVGELEKIKNK